MAKGRSKAPGVLARGGRDDAGYSWLSTRPLHVLLFLVPLMLLYELGSLIYLSDPGRGVIETIGARSILGSFFDTFGVASLHLPPIALSVVLLAWHLFEKDAWKVRASVLMGMTLESALWTLPILVVGLLFGLEPSMQTAPLGPSPGQPVGSLLDHTWQARLTLSLGAGIYEELLFRLILITAIHFILVDLMKFSHGVGFVVAAIVSALAFALYHDVSHPLGNTNLRKFLFFATAGLFFAGLFIMRGFGIAVGTHALYDVVVLVIVPRDEA